MTTAGTVVAVGLTIAAAGFVGGYALQAMKHMGPQVKQVVQSLPKSAFSGGYYRGGQSEQGSLSLKESPI
uniref:Mitochondrial import inner membrane translocase subunit TIM14 n=1 Tax=Monodon monoceros TaxID=40151 RepID=A0A8C6F936_MONMO